jgi:hypothetical protein
MLVDAGANVNVKHQKTGLTPLQVTEPDYHTKLFFMVIPSSLIDGMLS